MADTLFKGKPPQGMPPGMSEKITQEAARLKLLEERYSNLVRRAELIEKNLLLFEQDTRRDFKVLQTKISSVSRQIGDMTEKVDEMRSELERTATKFDLKVIERSFDMWQPLHLITKEQAEQMILTIKEQRNL